jgi:hypothetical protein
MIKIQPISIDGNVKQNPIDSLTALARLAMDGNLRALVTMINGFQYSRAELELTLARCGVGDLQELVGMPHLIAAVARAFIVLPPWVQFVHKAIGRLTPNNWHRVSYALPYAIKSTDDPERMCLVNRAYKPIGVSERLGFVRYEGATPSHIRRHHFEALERAGVVSPCGSFYNSACHPSGSAANCDAYRHKIELLLAPWVAL